MSKFMVQSYEYNSSGADVRQEIAALLERVWPNPEPLASSQCDAPTHREALSARSFCCREEGRLVGYAGVVQMTVRHAGQDYRAAGLSCVAVLPDWQGRGVGRAVVGAASDWLKAQSGIDFGIFTCQPSLAGFYNGAGGWESCPDMVLLSSHEKEALSSENLGVVVMLRLFSEKARKNESALRREPVNLDFPVGEFL